MGKRTQGNYELLSRNNPRMLSHYKGGICAPGIEITLAQPNTPLQKRHDHQRTCRSSWPSSSMRGKSPVGLGIEVPGLGALLASEA